VESDGYNKGSTFKFSIPLSSGESQMHKQ
jgi:hypothetical protein